MSSSSSPQPQLIWLVTGTSSGLGLALSQHILSTLQHHLISISRHATPHASLSALTSSTGSASKLTHITMELSTSTPTDFQHAIHTALTQHPRIDIVINNAGTAHFEPLETLTAPTLERIMHVNFLSPLYLCQSVLPHFRVQNNRPIAPTILNVSSTQGLCSDAAEGAYDASKHALESMSAVLAREVAPAGVRVGVVNLGAFRTGLTDASSFDPASTASGVGDAEGKVYWADGHPVRRRVEMVRTYGRQARGDPKRAAGVVVDAILGKGEAGRAVQSKWKEGGLELARLILGPDAHVKIGKRLDELREDWERSKVISAMTDLEEQGKES